MVIEYAQLTTKNRCAGANMTGRLKVHVHSRTPGPELTFDMLQIKTTRFLLLVLFHRAMTHKATFILFNLAINGNIPEPLICAFGPSQ